MSNQTIPNSLLDFKGARLVKAIETVSFDVLTTTEFIALQQKSHCIEVDGDGRFIKFFLK